MALVLGRVGDGAFIDYTTEPCAFLVRIRTVTDTTGQILAANYGFFPSHIRKGIFEFETMWLSFEYYLNPDPSPEARSLEPASLAARQ